MRPTLEQVLDWARQAAQIALQMQSRDIEKHYKARAELVTAADSAVENFLIERIQAAFPHHSIVAEESGVQDNASDHKWYIDPIDGTINYAHGLPLYGTSVAYAFRGELEIAVICFPGMKEDFWAERGQGAYCNGMKISVSETSSLSESVLATGFRKYAIGTPNSNVNNFARFSKEAQTIRRLGSATVNLAYVACGRMEGFWELELSPWDVAAGILIVREAGGIVEGLYEKRDLLSGRTNLLAANPAIFPKMRAVLLEEKTE